MEYTEKPKKKLKCAAISPNTYELIRGLKKAHPLKYVNIKQIMELGILELYTKEKIPVPEAPKPSIEEKIPVPEAPRPSIEEEMPALDEINQDTI